MKRPRLRDYLAHMDQAASDACLFVEGMDRAGFLQDKRTQQAVILSLIVLGEAATKLMEHHPDFVQAQAQIPWLSMRGMRNRMTHGYFDINLELVWDTVQTALPSLLAQLRELPAADV